MFSAPQFLTIIINVLNVHEIALAQEFVRPDGNNLAGWCLIWSLEFN